MNELAPPGEILRDPKSVELLRAWVSNDQLIVALKSIEPLAGPAMYGMVLADIARHAADMLHKGSGYPKTATLSEICRVFFDEMKSDTGNAMGGFVEPKPTA
jgi:hypothetical protein